ncbi:MAG TPA: proton-conducting transporter membrane subunit, partial [Bdellovibrionota bacterium]|nr:proton-conducting transporter membrane subunit [Bdellovibrionota bacterium]
VAPRFAAVFFLMTLTAIGLPGLCGFVGEFLILAGSFRALALDHPAWFVGLAVVGIILGAVYMLSLYERIFWGTVRFKENETFRDLRWQEVATLAMPIVLAVWLGIQPNLILSRISPSVQSIVSRVRVQSVAELP